MHPQFGDAHDISDRGEIHLTGADHFRGSDDESKREGSDDAGLRRPGLFSDDPMDLFLQEHWKLKLHFFHMTTTELKIIIKADYPEDECKYADDEIDPFGDHRETAQLTEARHQPHPGDDVGDKDTKGEDDAVGEDLF